ncbi:MAG: hypothetical protein AOA65_2244 [Candidatus Bathyarchaeota archaeon BA1]|nr:MAG: hypothetical protein AOA65_2244 [Candidatus Bathyarchaeota archaeon BA1]
MILKLGALEIMVKSFSGRGAPQRKGFIPIDTCFSGGILLPRDDYEFFTIGEHPRSLWRAYRTLIGTIEMRTTRSYTEIKGLHETLR